MKKLKPDSVLRRDDNDKRRVFLINVAKKALCVGAPVLSCLRSPPLFLPQVSQFSPIYTFHMPLARSRVV